MSLLIEAKTTSTYAVCWWCLTEKFLFLSLSLSVSCEQTVSVCRKYDFMHSGYSCSVALGWMIGKKGKYCRIWLLVAALLSEIYSWSVYAWILWLKDHTLQSECWWSCFCPLWVAFTSLMVRNRICASALLSLWVWTGSSGSGAAFQMQNAPSGWLRDLHFSPTVRWLQLKASRPLCFCQFGLSIANPAMHILLSNPKRNKSEG